MAQFIEFWNSNWDIIMGIGGLFLGVLGVFATIIAYLRSKNQVEPIIYYENIPEIRKLSNGNRKITVSYGQEQVDRVTTTRIWFWNNGVRAIRNEDIPNTDPLRITFKGRNSEPIILDFRVIKSTRGSLNFDLKKIDCSQSTIYLSFDFIDSNDGVVFEIQHTGDDETHIYLDGVILGPKKNTKIRGDKYLKFSYIYEIFVPSTIFSVLIGLLSFILVSYKVGSNNFLKVSFLVIAIILLIVIMKFKKLPYPKELSLQNKKERITINSILKTFGIEEIEQFDDDEIEKIEKIDDKIIITDKFGNKISNDSKISFIRRKP